MNCQKYHMMRSNFILLRSFSQICRRDMSSLRSRPYTVVVEGNIGSGKTTFMDHFKQYEDVALFSEPVDKWTNVESHNLLGIMYKDPKKWAMTFQSYVQLTMVNMHKQRCPEPIKMMERSLYSARFCFVENLYENGYLDGPEYVVLDEWFKWICSNLDIGVDMIVYLRTHPEVALERMKLRGREEESCVSLSYLRQLHNLHEKWLCPGGVPITSPPVYVVDANRSFSEMEKEMKRISPLICNRNNGSLTNDKAAQNLS
ncbi:hypothetical protein J437_LFUL011258 [Ladona fulva]|uniref:Deoxynucleoside kinase domain-containing protein n=1 Tax=Ladona fulva TaxID=123851 RepID=A0A8K0P6C1_LADFU|nr:hypothetical protein J437_LFUL011258 [Ladona fulva]